MKTRRTDRFSALPGVINMKRLTAIAASILMLAACSVLPTNSDLEHGESAGTLNLSVGPDITVILDAPPGTGDEPLTVAQTIPTAEALILTTPQEISLADVRKSINFCHQVNMKILGVVENMSGFICPDCGKKIDIFGSGGGADMSSQMKVPFLGEIPIEPEMVKMGDTGNLQALVDRPDLELNKAYEQILNKIIEG